MRTLSLRRLLAQLTVLALSAAPAQAGPRSSLARRAVDIGLEEDLLIDRESVDPDDAAAVLGRTLVPALRAMRPIEATHVATTWAVSADPVRRAAIANALEDPFQLLGADLVIEHLAHDPDATIRVACARAARARDDKRILAILANDADPEVRATARS